MRTPAAQLLKEGELIISDITALQHRQRERASEILNEGELILAREPIFCTKFT